LQPFLLSTIILTCERSTRAKPSRGEVNEMFHHAANDKLARKLDFQGANNDVLVIHPLQLDFIRWVTYCFSPSQSQQRPRLAPVTESTHTMTVANTCRTIFGLLLSLHFVLAQVLAQDCYYPNGDVSTVDAPCSSSGGMCCAVGWECLSNGLCYYEPDGYYERRSCTDQSWGSDCSQFCVTGSLA
jgi:hypothetical protein